MFSLLDSRCDIDEEPEDEDELLLRATYKKMQKKPNRNQVSHWMQL